MPEEKSPRCIRNDAAEAELLGMLLLAPDTLAEVACRLTEHHFGSVPHQLIFAAMLRCLRAGTPADIIAVATELGDKLTMCGGAPYLSELHDSVVTAVMWEHRANQVVDAYTMRSLWYAINDTRTRIERSAGEPAEILAEHETKLLAIRATKRNVESVSLPVVAAQVLDAVNRRKNRGEPLGVPSGFIDLDRVMRFEPAGIYILAARTSQGKSSLATNIAANVGKRGKVLFITLEMSAEQLAERLLAMESGIDVHRLRNGMVSIAELDQLGAASADLPSGVWIADMPSPTVTEILSVGRRFAMRHDLLLVVIDYLQLIRSEDRKANRNEQLTAIMAGLKAMAKQLRSPLLILSQLSRDIEKRSNPKPMLSDLRESGAIEQDADVVMFITNPEPDDKESNVREIEIAKNRQGATAAVKMCFERHLTRFRDFAQEITPWEPGGDW